MVAVLRSRLGLPAEDAELRRQWRAYCDERKRLAEAGVRLLPECPPEFYGLTCGAITREGTLCASNMLYRNGT